MLRLAALQLMIGLLLASAAAADAAEFDCVVSPSRTIALASPTGGLIAKVEVKEGQRIAAGDVVARLASSVEEATVALYRLQASDSSALDAERSRLKFLEARLQRTERLAATGVVAQERLEQMQTDVATSRSLLASAETARRVAAQELARAEAALSRLEIRSPISGLVARLKLDEGEYLPPDSHVAEILQLDPLHVEAFLPADMWRQIAVGDSIQVSLGGQEPEVHDASITLVDQFFDSASGTFAIRAKLPNPDFAIPAGYRCRLSITTH